MALVDLKDVSKVYGDVSTPVQALAHVTLSFEEQAFVAVTGRSGSGKSTLLGVLGAMNPPTSGGVIVDGIDVYALGVERRADFRREYLGFVFQQLHLMPFLTAAENVMLPLAAAGLADRVQRELAAESLQRVGLAGKETRLPRDLSGGEQQRVAIARALVNRPALVLADEPTGCLDSQTGRGIMDLLLALRREGLTIFVVTHDPSVAACADSVITLEDGRIVSPIGRAPALSSDRTQHEECVSCTPGLDQR